MRLVGAPRVLHDIIGFPGFIVRHADDGHGVSPTFPADGVAMLQGAVGVRLERVEWNVQQAVVLPVVGHRHLHLFIIGRVWPAGQGEIFVRSAYGMGKFLGRISGSQHKHPLGGRQFFCRIVGQDIVAYNTIALQYVQRSQAHSPLIVTLQHPSDIDGRQVHRVAPQNMLRLDGRQHGVGPAEFRLPLILDGRHGQQHIVDILLGRAVAASREQ